MLPAEFHLMIKTARRGSIPCGPPNCFTLRSPYKLTIIVTRSGTAIESVPPEKTE
jgi:hypothetical protein